MKCRKWQPWFSKSSFLTNSTHLATFLTYSRRMERMDISESKVAITQSWKIVILVEISVPCLALTYWILFSINGVPACANKKLLTDITRGEWGFTGYIVSDQGAIENIVTAHHYLNNSVDTVAACVNAGCNLELSNNLKTPMYFSMRTLSMRESSNRSPLSMVINFSSFQFILVQFYLVQFKLFCFRSAHSVHFISAVVHFRGANVISTRHFRSKS